MLYTGGLAGKCIIFGYANNCGGGGEKTGGFFFDMFFFFKQKTAYEMGYAFAVGKVCVGLKTDPRMLLPIGDNPMIEVALRKIFNDESELVSWIASYDRSMRAS